MRIEKKEIKSNNPNLRSSTNLNFGPKEVPRLDGPIWTQNHSIGFSVVRPSWCDPNLMPPLNLIFYLHLTLISPWQPLFIPNTQPKTYCKLDIVSLLLDLLFLQMNTVVYDCNFPCNQFQGIYNSLRNLCILSRLHPLAYPYPQWNLAPYLGNNNNHKNNIFQKVEFVVNTWPLILTF